MKTKKQLAKEKLFWKNFVQYHYQLKTNLKVDSKICDILLSNSKLFGELRKVKRSPYHAGTFGVILVSGRKFYCRKMSDPTYDEKYWSSPCLGADDRARTFAYEVKQMNYLSHFLAYLAAWMAKR